MTVERGRLLDVTATPERGERTEQVVAVRNMVVEQILSGSVEPTDYLQAQDEWVVLLEGSAQMEVDGAALDLQSGDWVLLPARTPHRLVSATPGTRWLAVHLHPDT